MKNFNSNENENNVFLDNAQALTGFAALSGGIAFTMRKYGPAAKILEREMHKKIVDDLKQAYADKFHADVNNIDIRAIPDPGLMIKDKTYSTSDIVSLGSINDAHNKLMGSTDALNQLNRKVNNTRNQLLSEYLSQKTSKINKIGGKALTYTQAVTKYENRFNDKYDQIIIDSVDKYMHSSMRLEQHYDMGTLTTQDKIAIHDQLMLTNMDYASKFKRKVETRLTSYVENNDMSFFQAKKLNMPLELSEAIDANRVPEEYGTGVRRLVFDNKVFKTTAVDKTYKAEIEAINETVKTMLNQSSNKGKFGKVTFEHVTYGDASYYEGKIERYLPDGTIANVNLFERIPIVNGIMVPNPKGTAYSPRLNKTYGVGGIYSKSSMQMVDATQMLLSTVNSGILQTSRIHELTDDKFDYSKYESRAAKVTRNVYGRLSNMEGTARDFVRGNSFTIKQIDDVTRLDNLSNSHTVKANKLKTIQSGIRSLRALNQFHSAVAIDPSKVEMIGFDLETMNLKTDSPQMSITDKGTSVWQAGFVEFSGFDKNGLPSQLNAQQFMNVDSVFDEQGLKFDGSDFAKFDGLYKEAINNKAAAQAQGIVGYVSYVEGTLGKSEREALKNIKDVSLRGYETMKYLRRNMNEMSKSKLSTNVFSTKEMAMRTIDYLERKIERAKTAGKQLYLLHANAEQFDFQLLGTIIEDSARVEKLRKSFTGEIDTLSMAKVVNDNIHNSGGNSVSQLLTNMMKESAIDKTKYSGKHIEDNTIGWLSEILSGNGVKSADQIKKQINKLGIGSAHMSTFTDILMTFGVTSLGKKTRMNISEKNIKIMENEWKRLLLSNQEDRLELTDEMEGMMSPDGRWVSFSMSSSNQSSKLTGNFLHTGHFNPFMAANQQNRDLHQIAKGSKIRVRGGDKLRTTDLFKSRMFKEATSQSKKIYGINDNLADTVDQINLNTFYTFGVFGSEEGKLDIIKDAYHAEAVKNFTLLGGSVPKHQNAHSKIQEFYMDIMAESRRVYKNDVSKISAKQFKELQQRLIKKHNITFDSTELDGHIDINGKKQRFKHAGVAKLIGLRINSGEISNEMDRFALDFEITQSVSEAASAYNINGIKNLATSVDGSLSKNVNVKDMYGLSGKIEAHAGFDIVNKEFQGSLKQMLIQKAVGINYQQLNSADASVRKQAQKNLKDIVAKLNAKAPLLKFSATSEGGIEYGLTSKEINVSPAKLAAAISKVSTEDITDILSIVGHEAVWNEKTLKSYYGVIGNNGDMFKVGMKKASEEVNRVKAKLGASAAKLVEDISSTTDLTQSFIKDQSDLIDLLNPLQVMEKKLMKEGRLKGGGIKEHYDAVGAANFFAELSNLRIPIFAQVGYDLKDPNIKHIGVHAGYQAATIYNHMAGREAVFNKNVAIQKSFLDKGLSIASMLSEDNKSLFTNKFGFMTSVKFNDIAKQFASLSEAMRNSQVTEQLMRSHVTLSDIQSMIGRTQTRAEIEKDLKELVASQDNPNPDTLRKALKDIKTKYAISTSGDLVNQFKQVTNKLGDLKAGGETGLGIFNLGDLTTITNMTTTNGVTPQYKIGGVKTKMNLLYVNSKTIGKDGPLWEGNLKELVNSINATYTNKHAVTEDTVRKFVNDLTATNSKAADALMHIYKDANGSEKLVLNGFVFAPGMVGDNLGNRYTDKFYSLNQETRTMLTALGDLNRTAKGQDERGSFNFAKSAISHLFQSISGNKDSGIFNAFNKMHLSGFQTMYHSAATLQTRALQVLDELESGKGVYSDDVKLWLKRNGNSTDLLKQKMNLIKNSSIDTLIGRRDTLMNGEQKIHIDGNEITVNDWRKRIDLSDDVKLKDKLNRMFNGTEMMVGFNLIRYPMEQSGLSAASPSGAILLDDFTADLLGAHKDIVYADEVFGAKQKADNDVDLINMIFRGFNTNEELAKMTREQNESRDVMFKSNLGRSYMVKHNQKLYTTGIREINSVYQQRVTTIDVDGKRHYRWENIDPTNGYFSGFDKLGGETMVRNANLMIDELWETQSRSAALGAYAKSTIGMWTNTVRNRIHEVFTANPQLLDSGNSEFVEAMIGDLKHFTTGFSQNAVGYKHVKTIEDAKEMTRLLNTINNPSAATNEDVAHFKKEWMDSLPEHWKVDDINNPDSLNAAAKRMQSAFLNTGMTLDQARNAVVQKQKFASNMADYMLGRMSALDMAQSMNSDLKNVLSLDRKIMNGSNGISGASMIQQAVNLQNRFNRDDPFSIYNDVDELLFSGINQANDNINRMVNGEFGYDRFSEIANSKFGRQVSENVGIVERVARKAANNPRAAAGLMAIGALGAMFNPSGLDGGFMDGFNELSNPQLSDNNSLFTSKQLPKSISLDSVNSSFANDAFVELNGIDEAAIKRSKSNVANNMFGGFLNENYKSYKSVGDDKAGTYNYRSYKSNIGVFGKPTYGRQQKLVAMYE